MDENQALKQRVMELDMEVSRRLAAWQAENKDILDELNKARADLAIAEGEI